MGDFEVDLAGRDSGGKSPPRRRTNEREENCRSVSTRGIPAWRGAFN